MAKILLIEDDMQSAQLVERLFQRSEHEIIHTTRGIDGLNIASQEPIDLILLDMGLPDIGGKMVTTLISRLPRRIPVVAVSGNVEESSQRAALSRGCKDYITKPIDVRQFVARVEQYLTLATADAPVL